MQEKLAHALRVNEHHSGSVNRVNRVYLVASFFRRLGNQMKLNFRLLKQGEEAERALLNPKLTASAKSMCKTDSIQYYTNY